MENKQEEFEGRLFLITHKKCGSILTIKSDEYVNAVNANDDIPLTCPSCRGKIPVGPTNRLANFFRGYSKLINSLRDKDFTIREIQPEALDAVKNLLKNPLRALDKPSK